MSENDNLPVKIFISYNHRDHAWAEWIAWELEEAGYQAIIQAWDFSAGGNFVLEMDKAAKISDRTLAVLSPYYFSSAFTPSEWATAFADDPKGEKRKLVPVRVAECEIEGLLEQIVYIDLVGLDEEAARQRLLAKLQEGRAKPAGRPTFPGSTAVSAASEAPKPAYPPTLPARLIHVPQRNPFFTGREEVLQQLHAALMQGDSTALVQPPAISGLGGIGKTQTAIEYAHRHVADYTYLFWTRAESEITLSESFRQIAVALNLPQKEARETQETVQAVRRWLETNPGWLLILDNADDLTLARRFFPEGNSGRILLTSRAAAGGQVVRRIELEKMSREVGACFLLRRAGLLADNQNLEKADAEDREAALAISREVDGLPLALDQAGAFIEETPSSPAEYLQLCQQRMAQLMHRRGEYADQDHASVAVTFSLAYQKVEEASRAAAELLCLCSFLAPDAIPEEILEKGTHHLGDNLAPLAADALTRLEVIHEAARYSLLERDADTRTLSLHPLVQLVLREEMLPDKRRFWAERAVLAVNSAFPLVEFSNWPLCERLLPHALVCAGHIEEYVIETAEAARLLNQTAIYLKARAQYAEAQPLYERALAIREKVSGPEHPDTASSLNNLALLYKNQGDYAKALPLYERALAIREKVLGPEHPSTATSLNDLANLYHSQGNDAQALQLHERALAIREKVLGPEHPDTASSLNNLAGLYYIQRDYAKALPLSERALTINERILGPKHPDTAISLNNLANLYHSQGNDAQALQLHERALAIREKVSGPEHPNTARSLNNLAGLYYDKGEYAKALPLLERALAIYTKALGPEHPTTALVARNYAFLLEAMGRT